MIPNTLIGASLHMKCSPDIMVHVIAGVGYPLVLHCEVIFPTDDHLKYILVRDIGDLLLTQGSFLDVVVVC